MTTGSVACKLRPLMVLGCTSDAGKSLLATGLCRWFARRGVDVAPFKAQNMSNNARVVDGGEIGVAQWLQALAAGVEPEVAMNPVLLKPEADTQSQVVVKGRVDRELSARRWNERHDALWGPMATSFDDLAARFDLVVIEGAGSPAEINLRDQVNNRMIAHADATGILVSDIDRGGSFAHLFGTWSLVPPSTRQRLSAYVLNRFRGDPLLLSPGPERLRDLTGMENLGVLPMLEHALPREEGFAETGIAPIGSTLRSSTWQSSPIVAIPRLPYGSNLDEFHLLAGVVRIRWVDHPDQLDDLRAGRDMIVLPGSKHVSSDLRWLFDRGLDRAIRRAVGRGVGTMGICGGAMMLGHEIADPHGVESGGVESGGVESGASQSTRHPALGILDLRTTLRGQKYISSTSVQFGAFPADSASEARPHISLAGRRVDGYEIRHGVVEPLFDGSVAVVGRTAGKDGGRPVAWADGHVIATTVHGLLEDPVVVETLFGRRPESVLEATFDLLADAVDAHLDIELLDRMVGS